MRKKKLGIFIPVRPEVQIGTGKPGAAIGCLRDPIWSDLLEELRQAEGIELVEDLNFRQALLRSGEVWAEDYKMNGLNAFAWYCEVDRRRDSFDMEVLRTLAREVKVIRDPHRFEVGLDKYLAHLCLRDAGVAVPDFAMFDHRLPAKMRETLEEWGAAVLKPRRGGWGKGVTLIDSADALRDVTGYVRSVASQGDEQGFFMERYVPNDTSRWASLTMIGGKLAYGYRKLKSKLYDMGGGRMKVLDADEKGGGVVLAELVPEQIELAERAAEAIGLGLIGFDMIWTQEGPLIVDENTSPGNYAELYEAVGKPAGKLFADWILSEVPGL